MLYGYEQLQLSKFEKKEVNLDSLNDKLRLCCDSNIKASLYCRKCKDEGIVTYLGHIDKEFHCGIRYCMKEDCVIERFARTCEEFDYIKEFHGLNKLHHFSIGFEDLPLSAFDDWSKIKKRFETIMRIFFKKAKDKGVKMKWIRVLDFSFVKSKEGFFYPHYHFGAKPFKMGTAKRSLKILKDIEKGMNRRMKIKTPFHFQSYLTKNKKGVFAYLSKRACGLYKYDEAKNHDWSSGKGKLRKDLRSGVYFGLKDVITKEQYLKHFYQKRHYVTSARLPHGSIPTDNTLYKEDLFCPIHGKLQPEDVYMEREIISKPPPDGFLKIIPENDEPLIIEIKKF
jgi:hypothetical protein